MTLFAAPLLGQVSACGAAPEARPGRGFVQLGLHAVAHPAPPVTINRFITSPPSADAIPRVPRDDPGTRPALPCVDSDPLSIFLFYVVCSLYLRAACDITTRRLCLCIRHVFAVAPRRSASGGGVG